MEFTFTKDQEEIYQAIVNFARKKLNANVYQDDEDSRFPTEKWNACGKFGIQGLPIPEEYGGQGQTMLETAYAINALAYGCQDEGLVFSICASMLACTIPIIQFGTEKQKQEYLPPIANGTVICGNAISEADAGSDLKAITTSIEKNEDNYLLNGTKIFVSNGPVADIFIIYAKHKNGINMMDTSVVIVRKPNAGLENGQKFEKMGLRSCQLGEIVMDNCCVPIENLLGRERLGMLVFNHSMIWERIIMSAYHVGAMKQQYEEVENYANTRKQFGEKIVKFQGVADKLIDMKLRIKLAELMLYETCWKYDKGLLKNEDTSMLKLFVSESRVKSSLEAVQVFGAYGYIKESLVEKQLRDSIASKIYSGTSEIHRKIIAESLVRSGD